MGVLGDRPEFRPRPAGCTATNHEKGASPLAVVSMRELLEAGVHFGHQTRRWNPKMKRFIFTERGGIYIIDLQQTSELLQEAHDFARNIANRGGTVLFVGTKKQAQDAVATEAARVGMPYVNHRWLGGLLTNWKTITDRIAHLHELRRLRTEGQLDLLPAKERMALTAELEKLEANLGGVADLRRQPDAVFIVDLKKEQLAVREARRLGLPIIALVDTNCDPDEADFVVPGNDDAIRSCSLIVRAIADGVAAGQTRVTEREFERGSDNGNGAAAPDAEAPADETPEAELPTATAATAGEAPATEAPAAEPTAAEAPAAATPTSDPAQLDQTPADHEPLSQKEATVEPTAPNEVIGDAAAMEPAAPADETAQEGEAQ